jgi:anaerobic ribonucleoside-triphosphate reductase activating protein
MRIAGTQFNVESSTLEIYFSGCTIRCPNCHNKELQDFKVGVHYLEYMPRLTYQLSRPFVDNIALMGGEPLEQGRLNLETFTQRLRWFDKYNKRSLWLYTGFEFDAVPEWAKRSFDFIKCGAYDENLKSDNYISHGIQLASTNQRVYVRGADY